MYNRVMDEVDCSYLSISCDIKPFLRSHCFTSNCKRNHITCLLDHNRLLCVIYALK